MKSNFSGLFGVMNLNFHIPKKGGKKVINLNFTITNVLQKEKFASSDRLFIRVTHIIHTEYLQLMWKKVSKILSWLW